MEELTEQSYMYDAFISYRHTYPDIRIAERLHRLLETYNTPRRLVRQGKKQRLSRVFRDREELPTSSDLNSDIDQALKQSRYLIVICSPRTPKSRWVTSEIERFRQLHGNDRILAILIEGEPDQAFPEGLLGKSGSAGEKDGNFYEINKVTEPLAADVRAANIHKSLKKLKNEKLRLLAPILGCRYDDLRQRHREREIRRRMALSSAVSVFFFLFGLFTLYQLKLVRESEARAVMNEEIARENEARAVINEGIARENEQKALFSESIAFAEMSRYHLADGNRLKAMKLALDALPEDMEDPGRPYVHDAEIALYNSFYSRPYQGRVILKSHTEKIQHMDFCLDGSMLATASEDFTIILWKSDNGEKLAELTGHTGRVVHCSFSSDATKLVTASGDGTVRIWDTRTGGESLVIGDLSNPEYCTFSKDGSSVVTRSKAGYQWWDAQKGFELSRLESSAARNTECIDIEHGLAVVSIVDEQTGNGDRKYSCYIMDVAKDVLLHKIDLMGRRLICAGFSGDADRVVTVVKDSIKIWDTESGDNLIELDTVGRTPVNIAFTPDGKYVFGETDTETSYVWECSSGKKINEISKARLTRFNWKLIDKGDDSFRLHFLPDLFVSSKAVTFNQDGSKAVIYSAAGDVQIYSREDYGFGYLFIRTVDGHKANPQYALFSPDESYLAVSYDDNSVCIYDTRSDNEHIFSEDICGYSTNIFNHEGNRIISDKEKGKLTVWDVNSAAPVYELIVEEGYASLAVFSPDGRLIAGSYNDDRIMLWDARTGTETKVFTGHESRAACLVFSHDGGLMAAGSEKGDIKVWNTATGKSVWGFKKDSGTVIDMEFSPDGSQLAASFADYGGDSPGSADIWSMLTGELLKTVVYDTDGSGLDINYTTLELFPFRPQNVEYNKDGTRLLCFSTTDATIHIIDTGTSEEYLSIKSVSGFKGAVFSPDGLNIATLGLNDYIEIRDADTGQQVIDFGSPGNTGYIIRYSHDGRWIMAAYFDGIHIYDVNTGKELFVMEQYEWYTDGVFSPDGGRILLSTYGGRAYVWELITSASELIKEAGKYLESCGY